MNLFATPSAPLSSCLTETFRPRKIADFIGLDKPKRICAKLAATPFASAWLFEGEPGLGKTTMAFALGEEMGAEIHHIGSQECNVDNLRAVVTRCNYMPMAGCAWHLIVIDEADQMTKAAQLYLLSKLDSTSFPPNTIFVFTCNDSAGLEPRFLSRCGRVAFSAFGNAKDAAGLLERVWSTCAPAGVDSPNFARIVKEATGNIRTALTALQNDLMIA